MSPPIYMPSPAPPVFPFVAVNVAEALMLLATMLYLWLFIKTVHSSSLLHPNLKVLLLAMFFVTYLGIVSRLGLALFQNQVLAVTGESMMLDWLFLAFCFGRLYFLGSALFFLPAVLCERCFSTVFVSDYERITRTWIAVSVCTSWLLASLLFVAASFREMLSTATFSAAVFVTIVLYASGFATLFAVNQNRLRVMKLSPNMVCKYTLSIKFQLMENVRSMKLVLRLMMSMIAIKLIALSLLSVAFLASKKNAFIERLFYSFYEFSIALVLHILVFSALQHVPSWKQRFRFLLSDCLEGSSERRVADRREQNSQQSAASWHRVSVASVTNAFELDSYFKQLVTSWDDELKRRERSQSQSHH